MRERNPVTHEEKLEYLRELREAAVHSASEEAVETVSYTHLTLPTILRV